jgi:hypothetical protein
MTVTPVSSMLQRNTGLLAFSSTPEHYLGCAAPRRAYARCLGDAVSGEKLHHSGEHVVIKKPLNRRELDRVLNRMGLDLIILGALAYWCVQALPLGSRSRDASVVQLQPRTVCSNVRRSLQHIARTTPEI